MKDVCFTTDGIELPPFDDNPTQCAVSRITGEHCAMMTQSQCAYVTAARFNVRCWIDDVMTSGEHI